MVTPAEGAVVQATPEDMQGLRDFERVVDTVHLVGPDGVPVALPLPVYEILRHALPLLMRGEQVSLLSVQTELTTQQAAEVLGVSRPFLIKRLDAGDLPFQKTGTHRRIRLDDLLTYKQQRAQESGAHLTRLTQMSQDLGLYTP